MENLGYVLSEALVLIVVILFAIALVRYRRHRRNQPFFSDKDRQLLFGKAPGNFRSPLFRLRLARSILAATAATCVLFIALAPYGAAIITGAVILTGAAIVRWILMVDD